MSRYTVRATYEFDIVVEVSASSEQEAIDAARTLTDEKATYGPNGHEIFSHIEIINKKK